MNWNTVNTQEDIDNLSKTFHDFHDSCLVSISYKSGAYVSKSDFSMCPINTQRSLSIVFQSQFRDCHSVELCFNKVIKLNLEPNDENYDCIISGVTIKKEDNKFFWADTPDCQYSLPIGSWVISEGLMWRKI